MLSILDAQDTMFLPLKGDFVSMLKREIKECLAEIAGGNRVRSADAWRDWWLAHSREFRCTRLPPSQIVFGPPK